MTDIARIREAFPARRIDYYPSIDSTMIAAAGLLPGGVVLADEQTAGQGRHGHTWDSQARGGVYCSIVLDPAPVLTLALGLAAADAITRVTGSPCDLRWPNDVMFGGRKLAGVLVQLVDGRAIAGIGINVNRSAFPPGIVGASLRLESNEDLIIALISAVDTFTAYDQETILRLFTHASSYAAGRRVTVQMPDGVIEGITRGLDPEGFLIVRKDDGTDTLVIAGGVRAAGS